MVLYPLRINIHLFILTLVCHGYLNPFAKFCLWALMIAVDVSVAICQLPNRHFFNLEKGLVDNIEETTHWQI